MTDADNLTPAQRAIGDFAPKLVSLTDEVLFGDVWERDRRPSTSPKPPSRTELQRWTSRHTQIGQEMLS